MSESEKGRKVIYSLRLGILSFLASGAALSSTAHAVELPEQADENVEELGEKAVSENQPVIDALNKAGDSINEVQVVVSAADVDNAADIQGKLHGAAEALGEVDEAVAELEKANETARDAKELFDSSVAPNSTRDAAFQNINDYVGPSGNTSAEDMELLAQTAGNSAEYLMDQMVRTDAALQAVMSATQEASEALDAVVDSPAVKRANDEAGEALEAAEESGSDEVSESVERAFLDVVEATNALQDLVAESDYDLDAYNEAAARYDEAIKAYTAALGEELPEEDDGNVRYDTEEYSVSVEVTEEAWTDETSDGETVEVQTTHITGDVQLAPDDAESGVSSEEAALIEARDQGAEYRHSDHPQHRNSQSIRVRTGTGAGTGGNRDR